MALIKRDKFYMRKITCCFALAAFFSGCSMPPGRAAQSYAPLTLGDSALSVFYEFDEPLPDSPGVLLRQEPLEQTQSLVGAGVNRRILYSSTDGLGGSDIVPVSGVLYLPPGDAPPDGWPLMAWTHGTVGIADRCAPSWNGRQAQDEEYLNRFLSEGYAIVASDYQGLGTRGTHPYLATRPEAYSNLDGIRAVQRAGFPVSKRVALFGQSQGAGAAIATAAYSQAYAPEIDIVGVIATGPPYFTPAAVKAIERIRQPDKPDSLLGYSFLALTLVQLEQPEFRMHDYVSSLALPIAERVADSCYKDIKAQVHDAKLTYNEAFDKSPSDALTAAFGLMGYPRLDLSPPIFMGTGGKDRDTPPRMQAGLAMGLCKAGSRVLAEFYPELNHREVVLASTVDSMPFLKAAFEGHPIEGNCSSQRFK